MNVTGPLNMFLCALCIYAPSKKKKFQPIDSHSSYCGVVNGYSFINGPITSKIVSGRENTLILYCKLTKDDNLVRVAFVPS